MAASGVVLARGPFWREWRLVMLALCGLLLAGCSNTSSLGSLFSDSPPETKQPQVPEIGGDAPKIALLLPLSATGETKAIAQSLKQAAEMALIDAGKPGITLTTKDTGGTPEGARAAAQGALDDGAQLILGPLLSAEVQAVSPVARARNVNVIAFSSVSSTAESGTYLMAFLPEEEVANVVRYASRQGYRKIAALYPNSAYGQTVEQAVARTVPKNGGVIAASAHYERNAGAVAAPAAEIGAVVAAGGQALLIPEGGEVLNAMGSALQKNGVDPHEVKILGTGLWDNQATASTPIAQGGWYAGVSPELIKRFESRYASNYGSKPPRIASLAYDGVSLAITLAKTGAFTAAAITNRDGFQGHNGLFRFRQNGLIERGLAILEVTPSGPQVVAPAPARFSAGS